MTTTTTTRRGRGRSMRVAACAVVAVTMCALASASTASASNVPKNLVLRQMKRAMRAAQTSSSTEADATRGRELVGATTTFCDVLNTAGTCALKTSSATCGADASCAWVAADSECGMSDAEATNAATLLLVPTLGVAFQQLACALDAAPACASVECEHFAAANACVVTQAEATTLSSGDAFLGKLFYRTMKCAQFSAQSACNAESECAWEYDSDDAAYTCNPGGMATLVLSECPSLSTAIQTFIAANPEAAGLGSSPPSSSTPPISSAERTTAVAASFAAAMAAAALA